MQPQNTKKGRGLERRHSQSKALRCVAETSEVSATNLGFPFVLIELDFHELLVSLGYLEEITLCEAH